MTIMQSTPLPHPAPSLSDLAARAHLHLPALHRLIAIFCVTLCGLLFLLSVGSRQSISVLIAATQAFQQQGFGTVLLELFATAALLLLLFRFLNVWMCALACIALFALATPSGPLEGAVRACMLLPLCVYFWRRAGSYLPLRSVSLVVALFIALHVARVDATPAGVAGVAGVGWSEMVVTAAAWIWTLLGLVFSINLALAGWHVRRVSKERTVKNLHEVESPVRSVSSSTAMVTTPVEVAPEPISSASTGASSSFNYPAKPARFNFTAVIGMDPLKSRLLEAGRDAVTGKDANGILLFGAPGDGKTFLAEALAGELCLPIISVNFGTVASRFVNETTQQIMQVFDQAQRQSPCVLFIDEVEALLSNRSSPTDGTGEYSRTTAALLARMVDIRGSGVVLVAATNFLDRLDSAAIREGRFDTKIKITPPDDEARQALISSAFIEAAMAHGQFQCLAANTVVAISKHWAGFSVSRVRAVARLAGRRASELGVEDAPPELFQSALREIQGSFGDYVPTEVCGFDRLHFEGGVGQRLIDLAQEMHEIFTFEHHGGRLASGILFYGPPGTGKTIATRALAKAAGWALIHADGTTLAQHPERIKPLLQRAVDLKPCVLFIDEADALIANRAGSWSAAATNIFLSETGDDRESLCDVLVIAATNHPNRVDPAMLRGGRFGEQLAFTMPTQAAIVSFMQSETLHRRVDVIPGGLAMAGAALLGQSLADVKSALDRACNSSARRTMRCESNASPPEVAARAQLRFEDF